MAVIEDMTAILAIIWKSITSIESRIAETNGLLTQSLFSTDGPIPDLTLDNARAAVALDLQALIQNMRSIKNTHHIIKAHPNLHYNMKELISKRNWLAHEYTTTVPVQWAVIATSIFDDVPQIKTAVIAALEETAAVGGLGGEGALKGEAAQ